MKTSIERELAIATLLTLLLAGSTLTVGGTTVPPPTTPKASACSTLDDATLANNVRDEMAKTMSSGVMEKLKITVKKRVVTLRGTVNFLGTRTLAGRLARKVRCVTRVINRIRVASRERPCPPGQRDCCCATTDDCVCTFGVCLGCAPKK